MNLTDSWPRQPFIGIALAAIAGIFIADQLPYPRAGLLLTATLALLALLRRGSAATYIFVAASFFTLHSMRQTQSPGVRLARTLGQHPQAIAVRGTVISEPKLSERGTSSFLLQLESLERGGETLRFDATISARWRGEVRYGDELQLFGVAQPIEAPRNPGEFNMRAYLARRDVHHALIVRYPENGRILSRGHGSWIMRAAHRSRDWMKAVLARGLEDSPDLHGLISGMVLGVRDDTPHEIEEQFQQTGTLHLFAVSGLNVAIVAQLLWILAALLRIPRRPAVILIIAGLFFYAAVTGLNTSSVRAALMGAVLLAGYFAGRKVLAGNSVAAAAVLILCYDTNQFFSIGFQLSFAVVIAIMLLSDPLLESLLRWFEPDPFLPRSLLGRAQRLWLHSWRGIARGASVSLAAWIGSLPLILPYFYLITPVSLLANLIVVPLAFFVLAVGLMSLVVAPVAPWLTLVFNNANWAFAAAILAAVDLLSRAPAGHYYVERPRWQKRAAVELTALDVGAGAAMHIRTRRSHWLIDPGAERFFNRVVRNYLRSRGVNRLRGLALTHGDAMHIGAATATLHAFRPRDIIDTAAPDRSSVHREFIAHLAQRLIPRQLCASGDDWPLGRGLSARVLFPPEGFSARAADDQALVVQLTVDDRWRILLMSDSGEATERVLLNNAADLASDVLIKGQHHSGRSGLPEFLARVGPELIVASAPATMSANERVNDEWAALVQSRGLTLMRQEQTGAVTLRFFRDRWEAIPLFATGCFSQHHPVNLLTNGAIALLECRRRQRALTLRFAHFIEHPRLPHQFEDRTKIIRLICRDAELSVWRERGADIPQELSRHDASTVMPSLRPWIGKEQVENIHAAAREQMLHRKRDVSPKQARVR